MISAVLFDADGVLQYPKPGAPERFAELIGPSMTLPDLWAVEAPSLTGGVELRTVLRAHFGPDSDALIDALCLNWTQIETDPDALDVVRDVRATGMRVGLATNQQRHRGSWMQRNFPYDSLFDDLFYSFEVGVAKPDPEFFAIIVERLEVPAREVVFIDDVPANVDAARRVGINAHLHPWHSSAPDLRAQLRELGVPGV